VADLRLYKSLRNLRDDEILAVGVNATRGRKFAHESGNHALAQVHDVISTVVDRVLLERSLGYQRAFMPKGVAFDAGDCQTSQVSRGEGVRVSRSHSGGL
jgi:hypothetical protein